jgi:predicted phosphoribosyltransferase
MFKDRVDAGKQLAERLKELLPDVKEVLVLGVPRGGVIVAAEVAREISAPLDVIIARKIGSPANAEYAIGAVGLDGGVIVDRAVVSRYGVSEAYIDAQARREKLEIERRLREYRGDSRPYQLEGKTVVVIDDGVATGLTMRAALRSIRARKPGRVIVALPVAPPDTVRALEEDADLLVVLLTPERFMAVGQWYDEFDQVADADVKRSLGRG